MLRFITKKKLMKEIIELTAIRNKYMRFSAALSEVDRTGYGIVMPDIEELTLEEPGNYEAGRKIRYKA